MSYESMSPTIHEKLCNIQFELLECNIKKSGHNDYKNYDYYELSDLLPPVLRLCKKYGCNIYFIFIDNYGILKFYTNDGKQEINTRIPLPELQPIGGAGTNLIQSEGAYQTYAKKYLLMNLFCISEVDVIDAGIAEDKPKKSANKKSSEKPKPKVSDNTVLGWDKLMEYTQNKYPNDSQVDKSTLNKSRFQMMKKGLLTKDENEAIYAYLESL